METPTTIIYIGYILAGIFFVLSGLLAYFSARKGHEARINAQNYALSHQARASVEESYFKIKEELEEVKNKIDISHTTAIEAQKAEAAAKEYVHHLQTQIEILQTKLGETEKKAELYHDTKVKAEADMRASQEILEAERKILDEAKVKFNDAFKGLAANALEGNNKQFLDLAQEFFTHHSDNIQNNMKQKQQSIEGIIKPLSNSIERYHLLLRELETERQKSYTNIEGELKRVAETGNILSLETKALKDALRKPHIRGRWGEIQLKNCVELAGMSEYADFTVQSAQTTYDGKVLIPDMTVRMPGGHVVYVDSKAPLDAYMDSFEAKTDEEQAAALIRHGRQVKDHVKKLATKDYAANLEHSADFTVMFLPNESFLYAALEVESDLVEYALQQKILIATPPTFIGLLKVILYGWNEEKLARNAREISEAGRELHKRLVDFVEAFENVGKHLDKAKDEYEKGKSRLSSRVLVQARRMETLGIKSRKELPEPLGYDDQLHEALEATENNKAKKKALPAKTNKGPSLLDNLME
ncbi:MAG: DNA recombination protein RmuC [bacterium]